MPIDAFLNYLEKERRYSAHTVTAYRNDLIQLTDFLAVEFEISNPKKANSQMLRSWMASLVENGLNNRSVNRKISTVKSYYNFLLRKSEIEKLPTHKLMTLKIKKSLPKFIKVTEMDNLLDGLEWGKDFSSLRDRLILSILYAGGLRLSEMIALQEKDFNLYEGSIKVLGKRNKERIVPLHDEVLELLKEYIECKKGQFTSPYIFLTDKGEKLYSKFVYRTVNYYLGQVTTAQHKSPHVLRHTFATQMLNNGADLNTIKEILGHANLSATEIYTHNTIEKLKTIYKQAHSRA